MPGWFEFEGTTICQPMFRWQVRNTSHRRFYENDFVQSNSLDFEFGVGEIFAEQEGRTYLMALDESSEWVPGKSYNRQAMNPGISIHTLQLQLAVDKLGPSYENLPAEEHDWWQNMYASNKEYANSLIDILKRNSGLAKS